MTLTAHVCGVVGEFDPYWWHCDACEIVAEQQERDEERAFAAMRGNTTTEQPESDLRVDVSPTARQAE